MEKKYKSQYLFSFLVRFILYFMGSAAGVLAAIFSLEYQKFIFEQSQSRKQEALRLAVAYKILQVDLREAIEDIRTVASLQVVRNYANNSTIANRQLLEKSLLNFSINTREFDQIRYIDKTGMEIARVNFDGRVHEVVTKERLQDKSQRYYFKAALRLKRDAIYISPLDLNVEGNQVERPYKPIIRFLSPLFDSNGKLQGMVVLNYLASNLLENFRDFMAESRGAPMMVNPEGYWLSNPDRKAEWGFMFGNKVTFINRYPKAWDHIIQHDSGTVETTDGLFIFNTVRSYTIDNASDTAGTEKHIAEPFWKIITRVPPDALIYSPLSVIKKQSWLLLVLLLVVGVLSAALAWWRANYLKEVFALRESEKHLAEAQSIAHMGNWVWNIPEGTLIWSDEIYRIFGLKPRASAATYNAFINAIHPDDREKVTNAINEATTQNSPYDVDHRILLPDGTTRYVHEHGSIQYDSTGKPTRMFGTVQDITESTLAERALRTSEARYRNLFENMAEGYALQQALFNDEGDPYDYRYLAINPAFERILGISRDQVIGNSVLEIFPDTEPYWLEVFGKVAVTGQPQRLEHYGQSFDRYFEIAASSPEYGLVAIFFSDVTERKKAEKRQQEYHDELEERVAQRTADLEASNRELEKFSYSIAHDLRTPLRSITSFSQILHEDAGSKLSEQERADLQRVIKAAKHMSGLIDDILNLARISSSELSVTSVNLSKIAKTTIKNFEQMQPERSVSVDIAPDLQCKGDKRLLAIVLENLLSNAWKYTAPRADAHIKFGETKIHDKTVYFVRDNGVGFDMKYSHKLFTPFGRLHSADEFEGTGIGLMSAQSAISRHKGNIWAESKKGEGSTFYFTVY